MNSLLWILQILLALHTGMGAAWKFKHSEQSVPSLSALPHGAWLGLSVIEILCAIGLLLTAVPALAMLAPVSAIVITLEMLLFCGLHLASRAGKHGQMIYWLVVAVIAGFIAYGRLVLAP